MALHIAIEAANTLPSVLSIKRNKCNSYHLFLARHDQSVPLVFQIILVWPTLLTDPPVILIYLFHRN